MRLLKLQILEEKHVDIYFGQKNEICFFLGLFKYGFVVSFV